MSLSVSVGRILLKEKDRAEGVAGVALYNLVTSYRVIMFANLHPPETLTFLLTVNRDTTGFFSLHLQHHFMQEPDVWLFAYLAVLMFASLPNAEICLHPALLLSLRYSQV